jgi:alkylation response protein AidB-like acyl-CoA dehydrogenase
MFTLVRTDPQAKPQAGITMLLIDMKSPGVTVRPILTIDGRHEVNEVFLDGVRVPVDCRVGAENEGWAITKFLLGNERTGIARIGMSKHLVRRAKALAAQAGADDARFRERAAAIEIGLKALEITQMRVLDGLREHADKPDPRSSILKVQGSELRQAASELLLRAAGPLAAECADEFDDDSGWATTVASNYFTLRAASIYGGSNEVQKNILAKAVLGL